LTVANTNLNANNDFIIGFNNTQGAGSRPSNWGGELVIRLGSVAGTYNLGIRASSTPGGTNPGHTYWTPDITANTDAHLIVVRYTQGAVPGTPSDDDSNSLWLDPSSANFGVAENLVPSPDGSSTGSINQNSPTNNYVSSIMIGAGISAGSNPNSLTFDELRVSTTWADVTAVPEPMGLAGVAAFGLLAFRRRRV
jgi:MYXO-CTERM domain-containing protein